MTRKYSNPLYYFCDYRIRNIPPMMVGSQQFSRPRLPSSVQQSTTSLPARTIKMPGVEYYDASTDEEIESNTNGYIRRNAPKNSGCSSRRSLPSTPPHYVPGGPSKFRFRNNGSCNGIRRLR